MNTSFTEIILKTVGFKYVKCDDGRIFLMERSDIAAENGARNKGIPVVHRNQNHKRKKYPKLYHSQRLSAGSVVLCSSHRTN